MVRFDSVMFSRSRRWWARGPWGMRAPARAAMPRWAILVALASALLVTPAVAAPRKGNGARGTAAKGSEAKPGEATGAKANRDLATKNFRAAAEGFEAAFTESQNPKWLL